MYAGKAVKDCGHGQRQALDSAVWVWVALENGEGDGFLGQGLGEG